MNQNDVISMRVNWNLPGDVSNSSNSFIGIYIKSLWRSQWLWLAYCSQNINIGLVNQSGQSS